MSAGDDDVPSMLTHARGLMAWSWEELAFYLDRSRSVVRDWTLGEEPDLASFERVCGLLETLTYIDRGYAEANQSLLAMVSPEGQAIAHLLQDGQFDLVRELLGPGEGRRGTKRWFTQLAERVLMSDEHWYDRLLRAGGHQVVVEPAEKPRKRPVRVTRG